MDFYINIKSNGYYKHTCTLSRKIQLLYMLKIRYQNLGVPTPQKKPVAQVTSHI